MPRRPKKPASNQSAAQSSRADRIAQIQRDAKARDRRSLSMIWVALACVLVLIGGLVTWAILSQDDSNLEVQEYDWSWETDLGHVEFRPDYATTPPAYGQHHGVWWNCGTYEEPIPDHHAVHSLEHGAIWLTYQPDIDEGDLDVLRSLADQPDMLLSPYPDQESPIVATAWGRQIVMDEADESAINDFIREYMNDPQGPEPGGVCVQGTTQDLLPPEPEGSEDTDGATETASPEEADAPTDAPDDAEATE